MNRKWTFKSILKEFISTLLIFFIISIVINYIRKPNINEDIYNLELIDISHNSLIVKNYRDKPLLVHFWATWCPTCKLEAPNIDALSKKYNVISIAVNSGTDEKIELFMKEHDLTYRVINDRSGVLAKKFGIEVYPTTLIYNSKGKLKFSEVGYSTTVGLQTRILLSN